MPRRREPSKTRYCRDEIDRLPFRVKPGRLQPVDSWKEVIDEAGPSNTAGEIVVLELAFVVYRKEIEIGLPAAAHECINRPRADKDDSRQLLFQR